MTKYIFVTGGVVSGLGKGITAASLGRLLKSRTAPIPIWTWAIMSDLSMKTSTSFPT